jgi:LuxR family transcriptional regulator, maltose regulon positive regulatory protein
MRVDESWIVLTKLSPPPVRQDCLKRERLFDRLDAGIAGRLVLVSTPAGFGKTTLLSSWYATRTTRPAPPRGPAFAWLTLERSDNDPARFWGYVLRALQQAHAQDSNHPILALEVSPRASTETFLTALLNAFSVASAKDVPDETGGTVLTLDEYQVITDRAIHTAMDFLLEHLPPNLHLVIASRNSSSLPLIKLRAGGALTEINAEDLRFSTQEIACFLQRVLPCSFTTGEVARMEDQTGGWIMPLHLATLAWHDRQNSAAFLTSLRGDHHTLVEYLLAEVFEQQPADIQRFLLATSLLAECTGPLCDAVLQQSNSRRILEQLAHDQVFLEPSDATHRWYSYHPIFLDFLRDRLCLTYPEEMMVWHRRAADWYLQQTSAEGEAPSRALSHLLAIQDWTGATQLIEASCSQMLWQRGEITTLRHWLVDLPKEVVEAQPHLALAFAWAMTLTGQFDIAETWLQHVDRFLNASDAQAAIPEQNLLHQEISGEALAIRARIAAFHDVQSASVLSDQALECLPQGTDLIQADLLLNLGYAQLRSDDFAAAIHTFEKARNIGKRSGNVRAMMLSSRYLASSYITRGFLNEAEMVYRRALRWATASDSKPPPVAGTIYVGNALLLFERNDVEAALDHARQGLALGLRSGEMKTLFPGYLALAQIHQGMGDRESAWRAVEDAERLADLQLFGWADEEVVVIRVRLHLAQGEMGLAARALSKEEWQIEKNSSLPLNTCPPGIQLAWARVLLAQQRPDMATALLQRMLDVYHHERPQVNPLPIVVLLAVALAAAGDKEKALALLADTLPFNLAQGYVRTFVDEGAPMATLLRLVMQRFDMPAIEVLLSAFPLAILESSTTGSAMPQPSASLSARELEVLRLLAVGLSNQQIADELVVALSTVRTHTKHIYRKLGVQGRIRAVARATALQVL